MAMGRGGGNGPVPKREVPRKRKDCKTPGLGRGQGMKGKAPWNKGLKFKKGFKLHRGPGRTREQVKEGE